MKANNYKLIPPLHAKKVLIVDWDDTIAQSFHFWQEIIADFIVSLGYPRPTTEEIRMQWGKPLIDLLTVFVGPYEVNLLNRYNAFVDPALLVPPIARANEFLLAAKQQCMLGIVSSSQRYHIHKCLGKTLILPEIFFEFIVSIESCAHSKPDPRVFDDSLMLLKEKGIEKEAVAYIGDSVGDYQAASGAGLDFIAVTSGVKTKEDFLAAGVAEDCVFESVGELLVAS